MLTYFGIWCDGSSIESCYFVTRDYDECVEVGTEMLTGFITSGPDDNQRVLIIGVDTNKREFSRLLSCVEHPDYDFLEELNDRGTTVLEFNYSDRDEFYYTSGGGFEDEEPDYENPRYEEPDFEENIKYYIKQTVEMKLDNFELD